MKTLKLIIGLLLTVFVVSLLLANPWMVETKFSIAYMGYRTQPIHLVVLFLITTTIGVILAAISMLASQLNLKHSIRDQNKKIKQIEEELSSLRNLPLRETVQLTPANGLEPILK